MPAAVLFGATGVGAIITVFYNGYMIAAVSTQDQASQITVFTGAGAGGSWRSACFFVLYGQPEFRLNNRRMIHYGQIHFTGFPAAFVPVGVLTGFSVKIERTGPIKGGNVIDDIAVLQFVVFIQGSCIAGVDRFLQ